MHCTQLSCLFSNFQDGAVPSSFLNFHDLDTFEGNAVHGRSPQNMLFWHVDYSELKLLKKEPIEEGDTDSPLYLLERRK